MKKNNTDIIIRNIPNELSKILTENAYRLNYKSRQEYLIDILNEIAIKDNLSISHILKDIIDERINESNKEIKHLLSEIIKILNDF
ncbi:MAG: hypothetical protein LBT66_05805 [Methanobrevibacter sp.]|jgi:hypothetical protein|nr:hypothetical protein [Candidatus Methanovirga meridionalis]